MDILIRFEDEDIKQFETRCFGSSFLDAAAVTDSQIGQKCQNYSMNHLLKGENIQLFQKAIFFGGLCVNIAASSRVNMDGYVKILKYLIVLLKSQQPHSNHWQF